MAFVGLKVDDGTKALWVEAADGAGMSLSAWLKAAAAARLAPADKPIILQATVPQQTLPLGAPPAEVEAETEDKIAEARALLEGKKTYGTDFKAEKKEKRQR